MSFVVPVHNGARWVRDTIESIWSQADGRLMEVIVVEDGSSDGSRQFLQELARRRPLRIVDGKGRGAAAAINAGLRAARYPIVCQVDQDVVLGPGWMRRLTEELDDPRVGAAQGYYASDPGASLCARAMSLDLEQRYASIADDTIDHVCSGNSAYRLDALRRIGLFDEQLGYGYDNDLSYRLQKAGYVLRFCRDARSVHRWRESVAGYVVQQYGFGYGRIDLVAKHRKRFGGDAVSPAGMMLHPVVMACAMAMLIAALAVGAAGGPWRGVTVAATFLIAFLAAERLAVGIKAARRFASPTPLIFPVLHLVRDVAWVAAIAVWTTRRVARRPRSPFHSMRSRTRQA